eukprot:COSAG02_NODE_41427_length_394_cov_5.938983_1_plen_41_part_10
MAPGEGRLYSMWGTGERTENYRGHLGPPRVAAFFRTLVLQS